MEHSVRRRPAGLAPLGRLLGKAVDGYASVEALLCIPPRRLSPERKLPAMAGRAERKKGGKVMQSGTFLRQLTEKELGAGGRRDDHCC